MWQGVHITSVKFGGYWHVRYMDFRMYLRMLIYLGPSSKVQYIYDGLVSSNNAERGILYHKLIAVIKDFLLAL